MSDQVRAPWRALHVSSELHEELRQWQFALIETQVG
jgi:hypothetical protein